MAIRFARRWGAALLVAAVPLVGVVPAGAEETTPAPAAIITATHFYGERVEYPMLFPVGGEDILFADDEYIGFGACRAGCSRLHEGVDVIAPKMTEVYAVADATVSWVGSRCCSVFLQHDDGWWSWYIHLNNDTPGTDDGLAWGIAEGIVPGARVAAGQLIGWVGDSGNAEDTAPHLHFELHDAYAVKVDPYPSLLAAHTGVGGVCTRSAVAALADLLEPGVTLRKGMQGAAVYELQGFLATRGYRVGPIDGVFGELTHRALRAFQRNQGIRIDGLVGSETRAVIAAFTQRRALASLLNLDGRVLTSGMRGPDVGELKRWLRAAGYDSGPRPFNGVFDAPTVGALSSFQQAAGLPASGTVDSATRAALHKALWLIRPDGCG